MRKPLLLQIIRHLRSLGIMEFENKRYIKLFPEWTTVTAIVTDLMLGKEVHASKELDYKFTQVVSGGLENVLAAPETSCIHSTGWRCGPDVTVRNSALRRDSCIFYEDDSRTLWSVVARFKVTTEIRASTINMRAWLETFISINLRIHSLRLQSRVATVAPPHIFYHTPKFPCLKRIRT